MNEKDEEREPSISKSKSRQFRHRKETIPNAPNSASHRLSTNDPPPINDDLDDDASSLSDNVEIPGLNPIIFDEEEDEEKEDEATLKMMEFMIKAENERLEREIKRMKSHLDEQETIKLKKECLEEIIMEQQQNINKEEKSHGTIRKETKTTNERKRSH